MPPIDFSMLPKMKIFTLGQGTHVSHLKFLGILAGSVPAVIIGLILIGAIINSLPDWFLLSCFAVGTIVIAIIASKHSRKNANVIAQFAKVNNWQTNVPVPAFPFFVTEGYTLLDAKIAGEIENTRFWLHSAKSSRDSSHKSETLQLLTFEVPKPLPTMVILPFGELIMGPMVSYMLNSVTSNLEKMNLEGDFNKYATVYSTPGQHIDTLSYMTPDVMHVIAGKITNFVVYSGNYLHISTLSEGLPPEQIEPLFRDGLTVLKEIREKQRAQ